MKWTTEKPTKPGWYWWKHEKESGSDIEIVLVLNMTWDERTQELRLWSNWGWIGRLEGEWAGPIEPPEEPS